MNRDTTKIRVLDLERMFQSREPMTMQQIIDRLYMRYDITVERKSVYADIQALTMFLPIYRFGFGKGCYYRMINVDNPDEFIGAVL